MKKTQMEIKHMSKVWNNSKEKTGKNTYGNNTNISIQSYDYEIRWIYNDISSIRPSCID